MAMGHNGRHGTIFELTITGDRVDLSARTYAHASCDVPTIDTRLTGTLDGVAENNGKARAMLTVADVTMAPRWARS